MTAEPHIPTTASGVSPSLMGRLNEAARNRLMSHETTRELEKKIVLFPLCDREKTAAHIKLGKHVKLYICQASVISK